MTYTEPSCAYCPRDVRACRRGTAEKEGPGFCPTKVAPDVQARARDLYDEPETLKVALESARVEA